MIFKNRHKFEWKIGDFLRNSKKFQNEIESFALLEKS